MKKIIIIISIVLIAAGFGIRYYMSAEKYKAPQWRIAKVDTGNVVVLVTATGAINPVTTVQVGAQVSGIVTRLYVDFDSVVKKNQVIAKLDTTLLYLNVLSSKAAVEKAKANVNLTKLQFERVDTLFRARVESKNTYDLSYESYHAAMADLQSAEAKLSNDKTNLRYATILAPCNGTVISRNVDVGQTVISSFNAPQLFTIATDLSTMQDMADVDEADIGQVKTGQEAAFTVDAYPYDIFRGTVVQIRLNPVNIQNVNNYIVVINVENKDFKLLPGLTATTNIKTAEHQHVKKILANAIHFTPPADYLKFINFPDSLLNRIIIKKVAGNEIPKPGSECYLWVKKAEVLSPVLITVGLFDGSNIEVSGDIQSGDEVVIGTGATAQAVSSTANNPFMPQMKPASNKK